MPSDTQWWLDPAGYDWRPLGLDDRGWDVYAFISVLNHYGTVIKNTGIFTPEVEAKLKRYQRARGLEMDGIAGPATFLSTTRGILPTYTQRYKLPKNGLKGVSDKESGNTPGEHTEQYDDGSWDLGGPQINNEHKQVSFEFAFNAHTAWDFYGRTIRETFNAYSADDPHRVERLKKRGLPTTLTNRDRWRLAFGSWNRPAHTAWLAGQPNNQTQESITGPLTEKQLLWIEGYMDRVTFYIKDWTP